MERYLLITTISSIAFYAIYYFFLRKESFHQFNRFYLLNTLLISLLIPFVRFSMPAGATSVSNISGIITYIQLPEVTIYAQTASGWSMANLFLGIYVLGVATFTLLFIIKLFKISSLIIQSKKIKKGKYIYVEYDENMAPFSFFNYIFINSNAYNQEDNERITLHEQIHVRQHHSWDLIFTELAGIVLWFNPILLFYKRSLQVIHEYLADHRVLQQGIEQGAYLNLLLRQLAFPNILGGDVCDTSLLGHHFNYLLTKNRFKMLKNQNFSKWALLKVIFVLPFIAIPIMLNCKNLKEIIIINENRTTGSSEIGTLAVEEGGKENKSDKKSKNSKETLITEEKKKSDCPPLPEGAVPMELEEGMEITFLGENGNPDCVFSVVKHVTDTNRLCLVPKDEDCYYDFTFTLTDDDKPLHKVEQLPEFPGGMDALCKFIRENMTYPKAARDKFIQGISVIEFVVKKDGSIGEVKVIEKSHPVLDEEAVRVIKMLPKWKPAINKGKNVHCYYRLPIAFTIQ